MKINYKLLLPILSAIIILSFIFSNLSGYFIHQESEIVCKDCNVILITIDTLRQDHLGCYGYFRNTSPNIDELANDGILFENQISQASWTLPSYSSMFTSLYPFPYGLKTPEKLDEFSTLAEILKENNYNTAAFTGDGYMSSGFGFNRGFDFFNEDESDSGLAEMNKKIFEWIDNTSKKPFFLFVHTDDTHCLSNGKPPEPYRSIYDKNFTENITLYCGHIQDLTTKSEREIFHLNAVYDGAINYVDEKIGEMIKELKERNIYDNSIIILTADHGEEIGDHGFYGHTVSLYDEIIHVPLIIKYPNSKATRIKTVTRTIDIMPTILDFVGINFNGSIEGRSLLPEILNPKFDPQQPAISIHLADSNGDKTLGVNRYLIRLRDEGIIISFSDNSSIKDTLNTIDSEDVSISKDGTSAQANLTIMDGFKYYELLQEFYCKNKKYLISAYISEDLFNETSKKFEFIKNSISCSNETIKPSEYKVFSDGNIYFLYTPQFKIVYDQIYSIRENDWKLIISKNNPPELYNVKEDPKEKENLIEKEKTVAQNLTKKLYEILSSKKVEEKNQSVNISEEILKRLKELGYLT